MGTNEPRLLDAEALLAFGSNWSVGTAHSLVWATDRKVRWMISAGAPVAQREPVANAVGDDQGCPVVLGLAVEARPVAVQQWPEADRVAEHELPAVRVPGNRQGNPHGSGGIECMGVVGQEDREGARGNLARQLSYRTLNPGLVAFQGKPSNWTSWPRMGMTWDSLTSRGTRASDAADELRAVLDQVVVAYAQVRPVSRLHVGNRVEGVGQVGQGVVDQVAGEQDQVGIEPAGLLHDAFHRLAAGEGAYVQVGYQGDPQPVQLRRQAGSATLIGRMRNSRNCVRE